MSKREKTKHKGIYKRGDIYYITYYVGRVKKEKKVGPRLSDALKEKADREEKAKRGKYAVIDKQERMTFEDLFKLYEEKGDSKEYILWAKETYLDFFKDRKLSQISRSDLFEFRDKIKGTPKRNGIKKVFVKSGAEVTDSTVNRIMAGLRRLFNFAENQEVIETSPFPRSPKSGLFFPEKKGLRNFFAQAQVVQIVQESPDWLKPIVLTGYYTGMRLGEILTLRWEHVNFALGIINLPNSKTLKDRTGLGQRVVVHPELVETLQKLHEKHQNEEWVFTNGEGLPYQQHHIYKPFKKVLKKLGIPVGKFSFKELRHTTGSIMNIKGVDPMAIKDQLRHTEFKTTQDFYIGSDIEYQREQIGKITLPPAEA